MPLLKRASERLRRWDSDRVHMGPYGPICTIHSCAANAPMSAQKAQKKLMPGRWPR